MITCDYLVIGAGAASLGFVDTLLADLPSAKVVIVDKNPAPGGQWNDAYDFVHMTLSDFINRLSSMASLQNSSKVIGCD